MERSLTLNAEGLTFGVTRLAKLTDESMLFDKESLLSLLCVAQDKWVSDNCLDNIRRAEKCYSRREYALAQMELALTGIRSFDSIEQVQRLFMAEWLLRKGETPQAVLTYAGITKYNPYHLGPGPGGGQFTTSGRDGTSNGLPVGAGRRDGSLTLRPSSIPAGGVQVGVNAATVSDTDDPFPFDPNNPGKSPVPYGTVLLPAFPSEEIADEIMSGTNWVRELLQGGNADASSSPQTITKPEGIPEDWIISPSKKGDGTIYANPNDSNDYVRVMSGNSDSPNPWQQEPYVIDQNGSFRDVSNNPITGNHPGKTREAHIPYKDFKFKR